MEKTPLRFIWHYIKQFKTFFLVTITLIFFSTLGGRLVIYYTAKLFDTISGKIGSLHYWDDATYLIIMASLWGLVKVLAFEGSVFINTRTLPKSYVMIVRDVFDYVNKHSIAFFNKEMSGNIANKLNQLSQSVENILSSYFQVFSVLFTLIVTIILLSALSVYLFLCIMGWVMILLFMGYQFGKNRVKYSKEFATIQSKTSGVIVDSLSNYSEVKSYANYKFEKQNLSKYLKKLRAADVNNQMSHFRFHCSQNLTIIIALLCFAFLSLWLLEQGDITTGEFIFANTLFPSISLAAFDITYFYNFMARHYGMIKSALDTLAVEPDIKDKSSAKNLDIRKAKIEMNDISFKYSAEKPIFTHLNVKIKSGEKIGLVGHSGSGKSTFIKLIARYFDIDEGSITINGTDIRDITQDSLRKHISTIPQDVSLFNRSLLENIRYGKTSATDKEVFEAAKKANADSFIKSFPEGYNTTVGERGVVLSGGERQRIAIARAILKNSPILVFDEATSALDSESEKHIQSSLKQLMKNKTVIAIAHRLSTLREMDRILVFDNGKIVEEGTHLSLLRNKKGIYTKMYKMQSDGLIGINKDGTEFETIS
ncbi:MAG: ABC transporter ATP-binding protein/permease [Lactobacillus sp.]|jgi:ATP-binding cassette subfamily B protein|nr:ABC transporter ATP-binding protein/permease [Lactobacillus sp.]